VGDIGGLRRLKRSIPLGFVITVIGPGIVLPSAPRVWLAGLPRDMLSVVGHSGGSKEALRRQLVVNMDWVAELLLARMSLLRHDEH